MRICSECGAQLIVFDGEWQGGATDCEHYFHYYHNSTHSPLETEIKLLMVRYSPDEIIDAVKSLMGGGK